MNSQAFAVADPLQRIAATKGIVDQYGKGVLDTIDYDTRTGRALNEGDRAQIDADRINEAMRDALGADNPDVAAMAEYQRQRVSGIRNQESSGAGFQIIQQGKDRLRQIKEEIELLGVTNEAERFRIQQKYELIALQERGVPILQEDMEAIKATGKETEDQLNKVKEAADMRQLGDTMRDSLVDSFGEAGEGIKGVFNDVTSYLMQLGRKSLAEDLVGMILPNYNKKGGGKGGAPGILDSITGIAGRGVDLTGGSISGLTSSWMPSSAKSGGWAGSILSMAGGGGAPSMEGATFHITNATINTSGGVSGGGAQPMSASQAGWGLVSNLASLSGRRR
jgi:hypothetical protein